MKVGIVTHFHYSTNYGGVLQAYALCRFLNEHGVEAAQIRYRSSPTDLRAPEKSALLMAKKVLARVKRKLKGKRDRAIAANMQRSFAPFRNAIPHTEREYTRADIEAVNAEFDAFITGSDQVWNLNWYDPTYFLDFVTPGKPKLSYAASLGTGSMSEKEQNLLNGHLKDFAAVSVREESARDLLRPVYGGVELAVDPTLLLSGEEWESIAADRLVGEPYVFAYLLGEDGQVRELAEEFAKRKNLKLVTIPYLLGKHRACDDRMSCEKITDADPGDFISLIKYANYVITDSFHACVFSIIFGRKFIAFERAGASGMSSRLHNLTDLFHCTERFCAAEDRKSLSYMLSLDGKDGPTVTQRFEEVKRCSVAFLKSNLKI